MYPLRLNAAEKRLYTRALRGESDDLRDDPDVPGKDDDEAPDDPKEADTPTTPVADPGGNPMRLVTANVKSVMSAAKVAEDYKKVRDLGSIILFQEIREGRNQDLLRQHLPATDWHILPSFEHTTDKIAVRKSLWSVEQTGYYFMSPKPPTYGRKRYVTLALVTLKGTSIQFLVENTHFVAHAWCGHQLSDKQIRKTYWNRHFNRMQSLVLDARSKGITVVGGGDFNRGTSYGLNKFHLDQVWLRSTKLDGLFGLPAAGGATFTKTGEQSVALNSDHNALVAELSWTAGTNALRGGYNWPGA